MLNSKTSRRIVPAVNDKSVIPTKLFMLCLCVLFLIFEHIPVLNMHGMIASRLLATKIIPHFKFYDNSILNTTFNYNTNHYQNTLQTKKMTTRLMVPSGKPNLL